MSPVGRGSGRFVLAGGVDHGNPSSLTEAELEAWNGAAVRLGREVAVATPLHEFIYHSLLPLELRARGKVQFPA